MFSSAVGFLTHFVARNHVKMIQLEGPLDGTRLFKCSFQGKGPFALKKLEWTTTGENNLQEWQSLVGLRNENVVSYHHCDVRDSIR